MAGCGNAAGVRTALTYAVIPEAAKRLSGTHSHASRWVPALRAARTALGRVTMSFEKAPNVGREESVENEGKK
jgi:hypothetical protein